VAKAVVIALSFATLLLAVGHAGAKDAIDRLRLCGASGCVTVRDMTTLQILMTYIGAADAARPSPAPYFTFAAVRTAEWPTSYPRYLYVPSRATVRITYPAGVTRWATVGDGAQVLRRLTTGIRPYASPRTWRSVAVTHSATARIAATPATRP
jgi:hypothetical protein